jgi:hypothetical protein
LTGKDVLEMQLIGSFNILGERLATVSDQEWIDREIPDTSMVGFTFWHAARTIDWGIHCAIQGMPEVADRVEWRRLRAADLAFGAGITPVEADGVAQSVSRTDVEGYLGAVKESALGWLRDRSDADLGQVPDFQAHQRVKPRYLTPPVWDQVSDLAGRPAWHVLARPCISHIRVHAGEIDMLLASLRARAPR